MGGGGWVLAPNTLDLDTFKHLEAFGMKGVGRYGPGVAFLVQFLGD